jgi:signal transduction histidine kinase
VRPIRQLDLQTATIAGGRFQPVAVPARDDEIRDLTRSINSMTERLGRYETEVRQNEQLRTLGRLGAGMAHQLRNSATGARMAIELHLRVCPADSDRESLEVALRQLRLMESYLQRFLGLGRDRPIDRKQVDLERLVDDVFELVRPACLHSKIDLTRRRSSEQLVVWGDSESLAELLVNLILNALEAARQNGDVPPKVVVEAGGEKDRAVLRVLDTGVGPAVAVQQRLFEPFVTEKPGGTGLGLFVARRIAEAHRGRIDWDRREEMTCFTVELPINHRGE